MSEDTEREALRSAIVGVLVDASNFPYEVQFRILGQDMGPLRQKLTEAILTKFLPEHDKRMRAEVGERAWREGYYAGKRDYAGSITGGMPVRSSNPYRGES